MREIAYLVCKTACLASAQSNAHLRIILGAPDPSIYAHLNFGALRRKIESIALHVQDAARVDFGF